MSDVMCGIRFVNGKIEYMFKLEDGTILRTMNRKEADKISKDIDKGKIKIVSMTEEDLH